MFGKDQLQENEIPDLIKGLENLKETYIEDETLVKKINILIKGFNSQLDMT